MDIYVGFHQYLGLKNHYAIAECVEAWESETAMDQNLVISYIGSPTHFVLKYGSRYIAAFRKTAFVQERLTAILADKDAQHATALAEQLRRSRFTTWVYIMEDMRNGTFKIGRSKAPGKRERTLQSEVPETILRFSVPADDAHEKALHARYQPQNVRGEWFTLTPDQLIEVITFLKTNGDADRAFSDLEWLGALFLRTGRGLPKPKLTDDLSDSTGDLFGG